MSNLDDLFIKALEEADRGRPSVAHSRATAKMLGSAARGIANYVPFHALSGGDQARARNQYPHKSVGGKYDFRDEHYFYPVDKKGRLYSGRGAQRVLGLSHDSIVSGEIEKLNYKKNISWKD
jgi:hypothetical protein